MPNTENSTVDSLQENLENLPEQLGEITQKISELGVFDLFTSPIARREWTSHLIERSLSSTTGWIEFLCAVTLMFVGYLIIDKATHKKKQSQESGPSFVGPTARLPFWKHLRNRWAWPILLAISSFLIVKILQYFGHQPLWFGLVLVAAAWMMMIRFMVAMLSYALPSKFFNQKHEAVLATTVWGIFLMWITGVTDIAINWTEAIKLTVGESSISLFDILNGVIWVVVTLIMAMWVAKTLENRLMGFNRIDMSLRIALSNIIKTLLIFLSFLIALPLVGIDLTVLSVFGGALGVGLGFGLQKVASNYVSGFIVLFDRSIRVGDRVNVNNFTGYVTKITTRYTVVQDSNGAEALVPNENFIASMVINESYSGKALWRTLPIQVSYETNLPQALAIMQAAAEKQERVQGSALATLVGFADNGINLNLGFWVKDPENGFGLLSSNILMDIWQEFKEEGIGFPYPQREVRILNDAEENNTITPVVKIPTSQAASISNEPSSANSGPDANKTDKTAS